MTELIGNCGIYTPKFSKSVNTVSARREHIHLILFAIFTGLKQCKNNRPIGLGLIRLIGIHLC